MRTQESFIWKAKCQENRQQLHGKSSKKLYNFFPQKPKVNIYIFFNFNLDEFFIQWYIWSLFGKLMQNSGYLLEA